MTPSGTAIIQAGQSSTTVNVQAIAETIIEADETAILTISANPSSYDVGTPSSATVTIVSNQSPVAINDSYHVDYGQTLSLASSGVLANDLDPDGDQLYASLVQGTAHGTLTLNPDGSLIYTPPARIHRDR